MAQDRRGGHGFSDLLRARGYQLRGDGVADAATQALLFSDEVADADYPLKLGDSNGYVRRAQRRLIELGYLFGAADGDYGQNTADAVRAFQQMLIDNGAEDITASGEADENTLHYLYSELLGFDICTPTMYNDGTPSPCAPAISTRRQPYSSTRTAARCCWTRTPPSACTPPAPPRS